MNEHGNKQLPQEEAFNDESVNKIFQKAKWRSVFRNILISGVVSILVFCGGYLLNSYLLSKTAWKAVTPLELNKRITGPNLYMDKPQFHFSLLRGTLEYQEFKMIENRVIPWDDHKVPFDIIRGEGEVLHGSSMGVQVNDGGDARFYNDRSGERQMLFYHPSVKYSSYLNDLPLLNRMRDDQYIEMGLSFDKGYTLSQVDRMLPQGIHATWYWADSYSRDTLKNGAEPLRAEELYGFQAYTERLSDSNRTTEEQFINNLEAVAKCTNSYYAENAGRALAAVKSHQQSGMIIGVVVTGTKDQLKTLQQLPFIKAATLGATVDIY
ncbi:anti sigma factor C-terminal domain-containing protein [Paenibacillus tuaregi]|uniref:anti sigma factor C-terminal domain-containing protein n=1 Tax=Paenibacillus tuaregi TaxID=1816681 RepID=UPI0008399736|nr:anti sigma factor C-terminal domain-containing protein [Paenibacillus tuaregi]